MDIKPVKADTAQIRALIDELDLYQNSLYPPESNHLDSVEALSADNVHFLGAYKLNELVACCAVKKMDGYGEIKRLYVKPEARGKGLAKSLILQLEANLLESGITCAKAETGVYQPEANQLYERLGYSRTGPFGPYIDNPHNMFYSKNLKAYLQA